MLISPRQVLIRCWFKSLEALIPFLVIPVSSNMMFPRECSKQLVFQQGKSLLWCGSWNDTLRSEVIGFFACLPSRPQACSSLNCGASCSPMRRRQHRVYIDEDANPTWKLRGWTIWLLKLQFIRLSLIAAGWLCSSWPVQKQIEDVAKKTVNFIENRLTETKLQVEKEQEEKWAFPEVEAASMQWWGAGVICVPDSHCPLARKDPKEVKCSTTTIRTVSN